MSFILTDQGNSLYLFYMTVYVPRRGSEPWLNQA